MLKELSIQLKNNQSKTSLERFKSPGQIKSIGTKSIFGPSSPTKKIQTIQTSPMKDILAHNFDRQPESSPGK